MSTLFAIIRGSKSPYLFFRTFHFRLNEVKRRLDFSRAFPEKYTEYACFENVVVG